MNDTYLFVNGNFPTVCINTTAGMQHKLFSFFCYSAFRHQVRLAYNFQANKEGELSLSNGDEVAVIQEQSKDWLLVETDDGRQGLVPTCLTITVSAVHAPGHSESNIFFPRLCLYDWEHENPYTDPDDSSWQNI